MKQTLLLIVLALGMCSTCLAQVKKTYRKEKNGFEWYLIQEGNYEGAEDKNGKIIIPLSRQYTSVHVPSYVEHTYFDVFKKSSGELLNGICDKWGKEIIEPKYEFLNYYNSDGMFGFYSREVGGKYTNLNVSIDYEDKAYRLNIDGTRSYISNGTNGSYASSSSSSQQTYVFEFDSFQWGNRNYEAKNDVKITISISRSGEIKLDIDGTPNEFKCASIEYESDPILVGSTNFTFYDPESDQYLTMYANGIFVFPFGPLVTTSKSEIAKKVFQSIYPEIVNKTFMPSVKNTKRKSL